MPDPRAKKSIPLARKTPLLDFAKLCYPQYEKRSYLTGLTRLLELQREYFLTKGKRGIQYVSISMPRRTWQDRVGENQRRPIPRQFSRRADAIYHLRRKVQQRQQHGHPQLHPSAARPPALSAFRVGAGQQGQGDVGFEESPRRTAQRGHHGRANRTRMESAYTRRLDQEPRASAEPRILRENMAGVGIQRYSMRRTANTPRSSA